MCMTAAIVFGDVALVAADTRHSLVFKDSSREVSDDGGKLYPVPGGWLAYTGRSPLAMHAAERVRMVGLGNYALVRRELARMYNEHEAGIVDAFPRFRPDKDTLVFASRTADGFSAHALKANGSEVGAGGADKFFLTFPPELQEPAVRELQGSFVGDVQADPTVPGIARAIGRLMCTVAAQVDSMSSEVEIGRLRLDGRSLALDHWRAPAEEVSRASDLDVLRSFAKVVASARLKGMGADYLPWRMASEAVSYAQARAGGAR